jgi:hypothetical protein
MSESGAPPIQDGEILHRRVPVSTNWYDPSEGHGLSSVAFRPHPNSDVTGLSMSRARSEMHPDFLSCEECAALGPSARGYFVAKLLVSELRAAGISVEPRPLSDDPGHCELPQLRSDNRKSDEALEMQEALAATTFEVVGPFPGTPQDT